MNKIVIVLLVALVLDSLYFVYQNWDKDQQLKKYKEGLIEKDGEIEYYKETIKSQSSTCEEKLNEMKSQNLLVVQKCEESITDVANHAVKECKNAVQIARTECLKDCLGW